MSLAMPVEQEIDLRRYVDVLARRRRLIISVALLTTIASAIAALLAPPVYQATATIAITRTRSEIVFDERFKTLSDEDIAAASSAKATADAEARRGALVGLVQNGAIATKVVEALGDKLLPRQRTPSVLMQRVQPVVEESGNLIGIRVTDADPTRAAMIANAWATEYESYINGLYSGAPTDYSESVGTELKRAEQTYKEAQVALEAFIRENKALELEQQIAENQALIGLLQQGRETAVSTVINEEIKAQTQLINAFYTAQAANRLLAFTKQQDAKRAMLSAYIDAELENRLAAFQRDREIRSRIFNTAVSAELEGKVAVFDEQITEKRETLSNNHAERTRLAGLLDNAVAMRDHVAEGGDAAAASNSLALLLLKSQAFSSSGTLPVGLQLQLSEDSVSTAEQQLVDLDAVISALQERVTALDSSIDTLSQELLAGTGYDFLEDLSAESLSATTPVSGTEAVDGSLASIIDQRYAELFEVGPMATDAQEIASDTPLFAEIKQLYPDLFTVDQLTELADSLPANNQLATAAQQQSQEFLELGAANGLTDVSAGGNQSIAKLQEENRLLLVQQERARAREQQLIQSRDLAWEAVTTLSRKQTELGISAAVSDSEVRLASPALPPVNQMADWPSQVLTGAAIGLVLGVLVAILVQFFTPNTVPGTLIGKPTYPWNRAFRWVMSPASGLPER